MVIRVSPPDGRMDTLNGRNGRVGAGVAMLLDNLEMAGKLLGMAKTMPIQACRDVSWESAPLFLSPNRSVSHSAEHAEC